MSGKRAGTTGSIKDGLSESAGGPAEVLPSGNAWLNMLNKITSSIVTRLGDVNGSRVVIIAGVENGAGATTIGSYMSRLLSSYSRLEQAVFINVETHDYAAQMEVTVFDSLLLGNVQPVDVAMEIVGNDIRAVDLVISAELATTPTMPQPLEALIDCLKQSFHWVVITMPGRPESTLLQAFARKADGVVIVARAEQTRKASLEAAIAEVEGVNGRFLGTILNFRRYPLPAWLTHIL